MKKIVVKKKIANATSIFLCCIICCIIAPFFFVFVFCKTIQLLLMCILRIQPKSIVRAKVLCIDKEGEEIKRQEQLLMALEMKKREETNRFLSPVSIGLGGSAVYSTIKGANNK